MNTRLGNHYVILDTHAAKPVNIYTRFNGNNHTRFQYIVAKLGQARSFVNFHTQTVACAVSELISISVTCNDITSQCICFPSGHARFQVLQRM
ncbi:hypothetical protein D3C76_1423070 [compost metagenome]